MRKTHKKTQKLQPLHIVAVRIPVKWRREVFTFPSRKNKREFIKELKKEFPNVEYIQTVETRHTKPKRKVKK